MLKVLRHHWPLGGIVGLATVLYLYRLDYRGLWIDEFISLRDAEALAFNKGRLLYYVLLHVWMHLGSNDTWLRGLAVGCGLGSIILLYILGTRLWNRSVGIGSALLLTLSPVVVNHAQEVRYYTLAMGLGLAGSLALSALLLPCDRPRPGAWGGWVLARILAIYTTPLCLSLLVADGVIALFHCRHHRGALRRLVGGAIAILCAIVPVGFSLAADAESHVLQLPVPGVRELLREVRILTVFAHPPPPPYLTFFLQIYIVLALVVGGIALLQGMRSPHTLSKTGWLLAWGGIPIVLTVAYSYALYSIWATRYLLIGLPYLLMLLTLGWLQIWNRRRVLALGVVSVYAIAVCSGLYTYYTTPKRYIGATDHYRAIAHLIADYDQTTSTPTAEVIVWSSIHGMTLPLEHYYQGTATIVKQPMIATEAITPAQVTRWAQTLPQSPTRFWLIYGDDSDVLLQTLENIFEVEFHETIEGVGVFLLQSPLESPAS